MRDDFGHTPHLSVSYEYDFPTGGGFWFAGKWVCTHPTSPSHITRDSYITRDFGEIMGHLMAHSEIDPVDVSHGILQLMEKHYSEIAHLRGQAGEASTELKEELTEKVSTMPRTAWVVPDDPEKRWSKNRDAALARAWELTPAGGKRAEPIEVEITVPGKDSGSGVVNEEDFDFKVTALEAVADEGFVLNTELRIPADSPLDVDRDAALIWTKVKTRLRKEAQKRGMVPVNGTFKTVTNHDAYDVTVVRSSCTVREPKPEESEFAAPPVTAGSRTGRFTVTPPPMVVSPRTPRISGAPDLGEEAKEADAEYRRMKKLMKRAGGGHITKAQMHADLERYMSEERGEKS